MTRAPANLLAVRSLLITHLDIKDGPSTADLESAEVGIVGDPNHRGGYHCGSDRVDDDDYSVRESPRDRSGLTLDAAALDVGWFEVRSGGATHNMRTFAAWCVNQCRANTPDSRDIREIIYSTDGKTVRRWDRLGKRTTGDTSHRSHNHFSFFRDAIKAGRDQRPLFTRYLTEIGLLASEDDDIKHILARETGDPRVYIGNFVTRRHVVDQRELDGLVWWLKQLGATDEETEVKEFKRGTIGVLGVDVTSGSADPAAVAGELLKVLTPQAIAAAVPAELAGKVADNLAARLAK